MATYKVYKVTNLINKKIYVGITGDKYLSHRFWCHANRKQVAGKLLHLSIQKYGMENFSIELLCECSTSVVSKRKEKFYIRKWKLNRVRYPNGKGLNLTDGGDGSYGHKHSKASINKMSGKKNHNYGLTGANNPTSKSVAQYTLIGEYIQTFGSMHEAIRAIKPKCSKSTQSSGSANIMSSIKHPGRSAYGFKWKYVT